MGLRVADFQYAAWRDQAKIFDGIAAYAGRRFTITGNGGPEQLGAQAVTPGFLRTMGIAPIVGRDFSSSVPAPRGGKVALLTHALWMTRFGGDPSILSKQMTLDGKSYSVAGVLPRNFEFPENNDVSGAAKSPYERSRLRNLMAQSISTASLRTYEAGRHGRPRSSRSY